MDIRTLKQRLIERSRYYGPALVVAVLSGTTGFYALGQSGAATYAANGQAEDGVVSGSAGPGDMDGASAEASVKFGLASGSGSGNCALPAYVKPACAGVPSGTVLVSLPQNDGEGNYEVRQAGTVINGKHITGNLMIMADNVTVTNSQIDGTVYNWFDGDNAFTITDSTIGPASGCIVQPGIVEKNYTASRVWVRGHDDGFRVGEPGGVTVRDSYVRLCYAPPEVSPPDGSHSDGIQAVCGGKVCGGVVFEHNTVDARGVSATFMVNLNDAGLNGVTVNDNLLMGGAYVLVTEWRSGPAFVVHNNRIVNDTWAFGPVSAEGTCANQSWQGNTIVTIDSDYGITGTVGNISCQ